MKPLHEAADPARLRRIFFLAKGGRTLAAQRAILRTMTKDERNGLRV